MTNNLIYSFPKHINSFIKHLQNEIEELKNFLILKFSYFDFQGFNIIIDDITQSMIVKIYSAYNKIEIIYLISEYKINEKDLITEIEFSFNFISSNQNIYRFENSHYKHHGLKKGSAHYHIWDSEKAYTPAPQFVSLRDFAAEAIRILHIKNK